MKIAVIGTGYVGLVTGTCFAETGNQVTCIDIDKDKVEMMNKGQVPIYEPELEVLFKRNIKEGRLKFTTSLAAGIDGAGIIFLALPTPPGNNGSADLSFVLGVSKELGALLKQYTIVIAKSTVPVGTAEKIEECIAEKAKVKFDVVSNPEFLREGFAVGDFLKPDRVVVGTTSRKAQRILKELYTPFVRQGNPIYFMSQRSAEMTKYTANSYLASRISFMNEIANLCEILDADVDDVRLGIGSDERIGKQFLFPGIGFGGSCFPKDVLALLHIAEQNGYHLKILESVKSVNNAQKAVLVKKISKYYGNDLKNKKFALWGLAFKPDTDDIREAPALEIINDLINAGARVVAYDPEAIGNVKKQLGNKPGLTFADEAYDALSQADALVIATEWAEFRTPDFNKIKQKLKKPVVFDGRNLYQLSQMEEQGFYYSSIGRKVING